MPPTFVMLKMKNNMANKKKVGYAPQDFHKAYAKYYDETIVTIPAPVQQALDQSPFPAGSLLPFEAASYLEADGYTSLETGFSLEPDGAAHVAVLTQMPGVTPEMWDWWFGWHGCRDSRYKLWHPKAHISAVWEDGRDDIAYIGRNSLIEEYIGEEYTAGTIQFKQPA